MPPEVPLGGIKTATGIITITFKIKSGKITDQCNNKHQNKNKTKLVTAVKRKNLLGLYVWTCLTVPLRQYFIL